MNKKLFLKQECIPVGGVKSAAVAVSPTGRGGVYLSACWDTTPPEADPPDQAPPRTRQTIPPQAEPPDQAPPRTRHPPGSRHPPPPGAGNHPRGQTYACENITFATSLRTVMTNSCHTILYERAVGLKILYLPLKMICLQMFSS